MKSLYKIFILIVILLSFNRCITPKYLAMPNKPFLSVNSNRNVNLKEFKVEPLTTKDDINDIQTFAGVFVDYVKLNDSYNQIQEYFAWSFFTS